MACAGGAYDNECIEVDFAQFALPPLAVASEHHGSGAHNYHGGQDHHHRHQDHHQDDDRLMMTTPYWESPRSSDEDDDSVGSSTASNGSSSSNGASTEAGENASAGDDSSMWMRGLVPIIYGAPAAPHELGGTDDDGRSAYAPSTHEPALQGSYGDDGAHGVLYYIHGDHGWNLASLSTGSDGATATVATPGNGHFWSPTRFMLPPSQELSGLASWHGAAHPSFEMEHAAVNASHSVAASTHDHAAVPPVAAKPGSDDVCQCTSPRPNGDAAIEGDAICAHCCKWIPDSDGSERTMHLDDRERYLLRWVKQRYLNSIDASAPITVLKGISTAVAVKLDGVCQEVVRRSCRTLEQLAGLTDIEIKHLQHREPTVCRNLKAFRNSALALVDLQVQEVSVRRRARNAACCARFREKRKQKAVLWQDTIDAMTAECEHLHQRIHALEAEKEGLTATLRSMLPPRPNLNPQAQAATVVAL